MKLISLFGIFSSAASYTYDLTIDLCDPSGCHPSQQRVALDANAKPGHENQVHVSGDSLTLEYAQWIGGPRVYLIEQNGVNENKMFHIEGNEFSFDVELSSMTCGFNAAAYLVGMDANQGGAEWGTRYCDAQAVTDGPQVGTYCSEMDLFEGNTAAQQMTTHGCIDRCASFSDDWGCKSQGKNDICDHSGCGMNPFRYGPGSGYGGDAGFNEGWYGAGSQYQLDSTKPFTVTTQFHGDRIERFYTQNGQHIALPTLYVRKPTEGSHFDPFYGPHINEEYCALTFDKWTGDGLGPHDQMMKNSRNGMVLAMSAWYDEEVGPDRGMSWMDGSNVGARLDHATRTQPATRAITKQRFPRSGLVPLATPSLLLHLLQHHRRHHHHPLHRIAVRVDAMAIASKDGAARVQATARNAVVNSAKVFLSESLLGKEIWNHSTSCFSFKSFQERFPKSFFLFFCRV